MKLAILVAVLSLAGCTNTMQVLEGADYVCVTGDMTGRWTGSQIDGRGVKMPDGEILTPELAEVLCP